VLGTSGAGKSTLLRALAGLEESHGAVRFGEEEWQDDEGHRRLPTHQRDIGYLFQEDALFPHLSVRGNLRLAQRFSARSVSSVELERIAQLCGIGAWLDRRAPDLSGGEKRRVALARALCRSPGLLLLDEPFAGLDAPARLELGRRLRELGRERGFSQLHTSHSLEDALRVADQLIVLEEGRIVDRGTSASVLNGGTLRDLFPEQRGWLWVRDGLRHFVREDQLVMFGAEPGPSTAAWTEHVEVLDVRACSEGVVELRCATPQGEVSIRQPNQRVGDWALEPGRYLWLQVSGSQLLDDAPQSQPMRLEPSAKSSM
jgi:ABC-type nitrate/sulfonate/bicarbonate transport system ATPase subunit